ncbi:MAG: 50S ribosomal protein L29 [Gemmatirosa sp.]
MKADDVRSLSDADVKTRITELQEEQFRLRFRSATETLEQPLRLRTIRRDIARLLTVLRERELEAQGPKVTPTARRRANRRTTVAGQAATAKSPAKSPAKATTRKAAPKAASRRAAQ